jgi:uncharacterized glyoxalase superfamily protein PhnB
MTRTSAEASVEVTADPDTAFRIFTEEIDLWWVRGPINAYDASRLVELRLEPGVGGRVLEIYDEAAGDMLTTSTVTVWEPGARLVLRDALQDTETDVRFLRSAAGTRVTVSQYLLPGGDPSGAGFFWVTMIPTFVAWTRRRDTAPRRPRELDRLGIALYYEDPARAARWLRDVFQLGSWDVDSAPAEGETPPWIEFHVGNALLVLLRLEGSRPRDAPVTHTTWVHVDDLDAHFGHAEERGARIVSQIQLHGSRTYVAEDLEGYRWTFVQARPTMP